MSGYNLQPVPTIRGQRERLKGHSRLVGGSCHKQRYLTYELCLGWPQDEWIPVPTCQILEVSKEAFTGFGQGYSAGVLF